jgi:hypothetical protein
MVMVSVGPFEARFDPPDRLCEEREKNETRKHNNKSASIARPAVRPAGKKRPRFHRPNGRASGSR